MSEQQKSEQLGAEGFGKRTLMEKGAERASLGLKSTGKKNSERSYSKKEET